MKEFNCLRCGGRMRFLMKENIQLGKASPWLGQRSNVIAGALEAEIYSCPRCGKLEFFRPGYDPEERFGRGSDAAAEASPEPVEPVAKRCPECGGVVGRWSFRCPHCDNAEGVFTPLVKCPVCGSLHDFDDPQCPVCADR